MTKKIKSWGRAHTFDHDVETITTPSQISDALKNARPDSSILAHGMGRSYGDSNLNSGRGLVKTTGLDNFIEADWKTGVIKAQAGVTLDEILQVCVPKGWFLPVTPGSKFVTLGGAVANNVHGKNHHKTGSFGNFLLSFALHRSDRKTNPIICSPKKNIKLFNATIGGLGLTGIIEWVEISLKPIASAFLNVENIPYESLAEFFKLSEESRDWDYTVAWVDCFAKNDSLGRGIFTRGRFSDAGALKPHRSSPRLRWRVVTPSVFLNKASIRIFNRLYRWRPGGKYKGYTHYDPFFYPLDSISEWNRLYGRKGFYQYQCLIGLETAEKAVTEMLKTIEMSGQGSFLAVLKVHGKETSPGKLSFCREGVSLALDFPNRGERTKALFAKLDKILAEHNGRLYPAKDGHMSAKNFKKSYPNWSEVEQLRDPNISSSFWRRVTRAERRKP